MILRNHQIDENQQTMETGEGWLSFRYSIEDAIVRSYKERGGGNALLLGVGNGHTVPVSLMERLFERITVVDIDAAAMERFLQRVGQRRKYTAVVADVSGLDRQLPPLDHMSESELIRLIGNLNYEDQWSRGLRGPFDFIMTCQLTTRFVAPAFMKLISTPSKTFLKYVSALSDRIVDGLFQSIYGVLAGDGVFLHSTEVFEIGFDYVSRISRPGSSEILKAIQSDLSNIKKLLPTYVSLMNRGFHLTGSSLPQTHKHFFKHQSMDIVPWVHTNNEWEQRIFVVYNILFERSPVNIRQYV